MEIFLKRRSPLLTQKLAESILGVKKGSQSDDRECRSDYSLLYSSLFHMHEIDFLNDLLTNSILLRLSKPCKKQRQIRCFCGVRERLSRALFYRNQLSSNWPLLLRKAFPCSSMTAWISWHCLRVRPSKTLP